MTTHPPHIPGENVTQSREDLIVSGIEECNPNKQEFRTAIDASSCPPGNHCVRNGHSSLGGFCVDNNHKADHMYMPEVIKKICFICRTEGESTGSQREVMKPDDQVGSFTCGELDAYGKEGSIPEANCHLFQHMIQANELCGCFSSTATEDTEVEEEEDLKTPSYVRPSSVQARSHVNSSGSFSATTKTMGIASAICILSIILLVQF
eukprot:jgi/Psemu1/311481/fgenesh1_kg.779_\